METDASGTLGERLGDVSAGAGLGTAGVSVTEDSAGEDGMCGSGSAGSIFSSFSVT